MARLSKFHGLLGNHNPVKSDASTLRRVFLRSEATKVRWMAKYRGSLASCSVPANNDRNHRAVYPLKKRLGNGCLYSAEWNELE